MAHIELQGNESRLAGKFRALVDETQRLQEQDSMNRVKNILDQSGASASDWASVQALFGFKSAADAQAAYNLLAAAKAKINSADVDALCNQIG